MSAFEALQFRVSVNFADARNTTAAPQDFTVVLVDGAGAQSTVRVGAASGALFYPPGTVGPVPKVVLNTVRLPLASFTGVNLTDIRTVRLQFDQTAQGALLITDLAFASAP